MYNLSINSTSVFFSICYLCTDDGHVNVVCVVYAILVCMCTIPIRTSSPFLLKIFLMIVCNQLNCNLQFQLAIDILLEQYFRLVAH